MMSVPTPMTVENICFQIAQLDAIGQQEVFERMEKLKTERAVSPLEDDWRSREEAIRRFHEIWDALPPVEITDEEIEQLKHERRMRKML